MELAYFPVEPTNTSGFPNSEGGERSTEWNRLFVSSRFYSHIIETTYRYVIAPYWKLNTSTNAALFIKDSERRKIFTKQKCSNSTSITGVISQRTLLSIHSIHFHNWLIDFLIYSSSYVYITTILNTRVSLQGYNSSTMVASN